MSTEGLFPVPEDSELGPTIRGFIAGQVLAGRYTLIQILGRGGMGVVWLARDEKLEREIALKFLPEQVTLDKEAISDLKRETRHSLELTHPNIVRIHDFVEDSTWAGISMEYVHGETLSAMKVEQPICCFEVEKLAPWVRQLCAALTYAHTEAEVVHRDLKPANLMIDDKSRLKIADFGISKSLSDSVSRMTQYAGSSGTLVYMSPQQAMGRPPSASDDIYSLGATLYDLLSGKPPFYSGNIQHQLEGIVPVSMTERRAELKIVGAAIPANWEEAVAACLSKEVSQRPQSVDEIAEQLELMETRPAKGPKRRATDEPPVSAPPPPSEPEAPKKSRAAFVTVVLVLLAFGAGLGWYFGIEQPAEQEKLILAKHWEDETIRSDKMSEADKEATDRADALLAKENAAAEQKAKDDAAALKAEVDAAAAKAAADQKVKDDAATAQADADAAAAKMAADKKATDDAAAKAAAAPVIPQDGQSWTNSLGMKFVPAGASGVLVSIWDTRVEDFKQFADESQYDATSGCYSLAQDGWKVRGDNWMNPGFAQGSDSPVVGVSWNDGQAFCQWLTAKERKAGTIGPNQSYRLPTDAEWSVAVGSDTYPWGEQWPPPSTAGNYLTEVHSYAGHTTPVGSFQPNKYGLYDMGGNAWEWCEDWYRKGMNSSAVRAAVQDLNEDGGGSTQRVLRGAAWDTRNQALLQSMTRASDEPGRRYTHCTFRCVLMVSSP